MKEGISIIIPVYNEQENLRRILPHLLKRASSEVEIIVSSSIYCEESKIICESHGASFVNTQVASRAKQMNAGAKLAKHAVLYFIHADTLVPHTYESDIKVAIANGYKSGCYRFKFDQDVLPLMINSFFTRFRPQMFRGGDQSLFVLKDEFDRLGGFPEDHEIMEEYPFIKKLKQSSSFTVLKKAVLVSSRKYDGNSYVKVNIVNFLAFLMFHIGLSKVWLRSWYQGKLDNSRA